MGSKVSMPAAPAPQPAVDPAKSSLDYINAMTDPELQAKLLSSEQLYAPKYAELDLANLNTFMSGTENQPGLLQLTSQATIEANRLASEQLSQQRAADIGDVEAFGGRASAAFFNANPQLRAQLEQASASLGQAAALGGERQAKQVGAGDLGNLLMQKALSQQDLGAVGQTLQDRAQQFAKSTGELSADEIRQLQQSTRAAYSARGREMDTSAIGGEALSRLTNQRNRMLEDLGIASSINQASQAEIGANRGFQQQVQGADIARQGGNAQLAMQQLGLDRQFALQLAQGQQSLASQYQSMASDPSQAILGRPSQSQGAGMNQVQFGANMASQQLGPNLFDPNAGINLGLMNNSNAANYASNIYGSQASYAGATNQGRGSAIGGALTGLGALAGGALSTKATFICIPEGEFIDTPNGPCKIEDLRAGDEVIGFGGEATVVMQKHEYREDPDVVRFYRFTLDDDSTLAVCDMHRINGIRSMHYGEGDAMGGQTVASVEVFGGVKRSYDLLTLDAGYQMSGVPVNSMIEELAEATVKGI